MKFPAYVPAAVREHIKNFLGGGDPDTSPGLDEWLGFQAEELRHLSGDKDRLLRLAHDPRMREAYVLLAGEFTDDNQWKHFISAAWAANIDFSPFRKEFKSARQLSGEIADAAEALAKLLRQFGGLDVPGTHGLLSIRELLRQTEDHENQWSNRWSEDPGLPFLLDTVATAARNFKPSESFAVDAAIRSRKQNQKAEYLRAFGSLLVDSLGFTLTPPIMQAMATAANVAINLPDIDASYDDVRKALARPGGERLEDSNEK